MIGTVVSPECPNCRKIIPFLDPNYCCFCGQLLDEEIKKKYERPKCPPEIPQGHCDACQTGKYKACDDCGSRKEVKFRVDFSYKCLCRPCREQEATLLSLLRSW